MTKLKRTKPKHRDFIFRIDEGFYLRLNDLATQDGISMSGVVRQLVNQAYQTRFGKNGNLSQEGSGDNVPHT
jgi:hypothetical protein